MIITKFIPVKTTTRFKERYRLLGYDVSSDVIMLKVSDLLPESNVRVECICDKCSTLFTRRFSGHTDICTACIERKGHSKSKSDQSLKYPNFRQWEDTIKQNTSLSKKDLINLLNATYNVNLNYMTLNEILKRLNITLTSKFNETDVVEDLKDQDIGSIATKYNIAPSHIRSIAKRSGYRPTSTTEFNRNIIERDWETIIELQKTMSIPEIIYHQKYSFSDSLIRQVFYEKDIDIIQHSYNKSKGELEVIEYVKSLGVDCISVKFNLSIGIREIDCYCPLYKFGIEYCGNFWHSYNAGKSKKYHQEKTLKFKQEHNIQILTIFESEWKEKKDLIKSMIRSRLGLSQKLYARKCDVTNISSKLAKEFCQQNHLSGYVGSSINIGLYDSNFLVGVMCFSKSRFDKNYQYEITRMCFKQGITVIGGASKMFKYADLKSVMSYVDLRVGFGGVYDKLGMRQLGVTPPNYFYNKKDTNVLESRMKYQKHKLSKILDSYDSTLTEYENMARNNFLAIYDCGNLKFGIN